MKASISNYRQSPRKVRLVVDMLRGKNVAHALSLLNFVEKRAALPLQKLLHSAAANAKHTTGTDPDQLKVKKISVDGGIVFKRIEYRARGSANLLKKRTSNISLELEALNDKNHVEENKK